MGKAFSRLLGGGGGGGGGRKGQNQISDHDRAVLDLKVARDKLKRYQKKLDADSVTLTKQATALVKDGRRDRAIVVLKVKRYKQEQASKADAQLFTVTELLETVEWEGHQAQVLAALAEGNKALNALHEAMPLEEVEQLMADTQEALEYEEQISAAIGSAWTPEQDEELQKEFEALQQETAAEEPVTAPPAKKAKPAAAAAAAAASAVPPVALPAAAKPAAAASPPAKVASPAEVAPPAEAAEAAAAAQAAAAVVPSAAAPAAQQPSVAEAADAEPADAPPVAAGAKPEAAAAAVSDAMDVASQLPEAPSGHVEAAAAEQDMDIAQQLPEVPTGEVAVPVPAAATAPAPRRSRSSEAKVLVEA